jgi:hypothetical protein
MRKTTETIAYDSSTIEASSYDFKTQSLCVIFKGDAMYRYDGVTEEDYVKFSTSDSVGAEFNKTISKVYPFEKIEKL